MRLLAVDDARARMLAEIAALPAEKIPLAQSIGRVLAEDVTAVRDQPPFAASAMDGWAVQSTDVPAALKIVGEMKDCVDTLHRAARNARIAQIRADELDFPCRNVSRNVAEMPAG